MTNWLTLLTEWHDQLTWLTDGLTWLTDMTNWLMLLTDWHDKWHYEWLTAQHWHDKTWQTDSHDWHDWLRNDWTYWIMTKWLPNWLTDWGEQIEDDKERKWREKNKNTKYTHAGSPFASFRRLLRHSLAKAPNPSIPVFSHPTPHTSLWFQI